jgi:hypothetical protein
MDGAVAAGHGALFSSSSVGEIVPVQARCHRRIPRRDLAATSLTCSNHHDRQQQLQMGKAVGAHAPHSRHAVLRELGVRARSVLVERTPDGPEVNPGEVEPDAQGRTSTRTC